MFALRQVRAGIARHVRRVGRIPRDRARCRIARIADGAGRRFRHLPPSPPCRRPPTASGRPGRTSPIQVSRRTIRVPRSIATAMRSSGMFGWVPSWPVPLPLRRSRWLSAASRPTAPSSGDGLQRGRRGRCCRSPGRGAVPGRPRSPGSGRAARRPARPPPPARASRRTGGTGAGRWRCRPWRRRGGLADFPGGSRQSVFRHAAQHQRNSDACRLARPLPPARRRHRQAGEDQDSPPCRRVRQRLP